MPGNVEGNSRVPFSRISFSALNNLVPNIVFRFQHRIFYTPKHPKVDEGLDLSGKLKIQLLKILISTSTSAVIVQIMYVVS